MRTKQERMVGVKWRKWIRDPVFAALEGEATALAHPVWPKEKLAHSRGARGSSICADPVPGAVSGAMAAPELRVAEAPGSCSAPSPAIKRSSAFKGTGSGGPGSLVRFGRGPYSAF